MTTPWHYAIGNERHGPVSQADLDALIQNGTVTRDTLVWSEGMSDWQRAGDTGLLPPALPPQGPPAPPAPMAPPTKPGAIPVNHGDATGGMIPYKNPAALIGYYLFFASLFLGPLTGIIAVGLGIAGLRARRKQPQIKGAVHAWIAIIGGGLCSIAYLSVIILVYFVA